MPLAWAGWAIPGGPVIATVRAMMMGLLGSVSVLVPVVAGVLAWQLLRGPGSPGALGRLVGGWVAIVAGIAGIVHLVYGAPPVQQLATAGGLIGFASAGPLTPLPVAGAIALLLAAVLAGVLLASRTPIRQVPSRLSLLRGRLTHRSPPGQVPVTPWSPAPPLRPSSTRSLPRSTPSTAMTRRLPTPSWRRSDRSRSTPPWSKIAPPTTALCWGPRPQPCPSSMSPRSPR
ncbi:DNA translocase FtsK 4TM domain-containing protein [Streptosporangium lutulentum]